VLPRPSNPSGAPRAKTWRDGGRTLLILKLGCIALYASALASMAGKLPTTFSGPLESFALVVLGVHALEVVFALRPIRRYRHGFALSLLLTLLFGALHWLPLTQRSRDRTQS